VASDGRGGATGWSRAELATRAELVAAGVGHTAPCVDTLRGCPIPRGHLQGCILDGPRREAPGTGFPSPA